MDTYAEVKRLMERMDEVLAGLEKLQEDLVELTQRVDEVETRMDGPPVFVPETGEREPFDPETTEEEVEAQQWDDFGGVYDMSAEEDERARALDADDA